nr:acyl carrier protein-like protein [Tanacetum cinerariifolium]
MGEKVTQLAVNAVTSIGGTVEKVILQRRFKYFPHVNSQDEAKATGRYGMHAMSDVASELSPSFLKANGLTSVPKSVAYGFTASGYGFVQDMPYAYVHEFTRTSMAGKIIRFKGGYTSVWEKISKQLPAQVYCNTRVLTVKRHANSISVKAKIADGEARDIEFDKLIVSGSLPIDNGKTYRSPIKTTEETVIGVMDLRDLEKKLFSKVETIDYYTTVLKIDGLEHIPVGFYYFREFMDDPKTMGNPVAMQRFYSDTNIFLFWSYGNSADIMGEKVTQLAVNAVTSIGGTVEKATDLGTEVSPLAFRNEGLSSEATSLIACMPYLPVAFASSCSFRVKDITET